VKEKFHDIPIHHKHRQMLPVWFFIGILLFIYGVIILYVGVNEYTPPRRSCWRATMPLSEEALC
jgi:hypothetical protein